MTSKKNNSFTEPSVDHKKDMVANVSLLKNAFTFGAQEGTLVLLGNKLIFRDYSGKPVVDIDITKIKKVLKLPTALYVSVDKEYRFLFSGHWEFVQTDASLIGHYRAYRISKDMNIKAWVSEIKRINPSVPVSNWGYYKSLKIGIIISLPLFLFVDIAILINLIDDFSVSVLVIWLLYNAFIIFYPIKFLFKKL